MTGFWYASMRRRADERLVSVVSIISDPITLRPSDTVGRARELMRQIQQDYKTLPFARRWLKGERAEYALMQLLRGGVVHPYPVLWEVEGALVSQAEHTVVILEDGCEVITRP